MIKLALACLAVLVASAGCQISQTESSSEHNLLYQIVVPKASKRTLFYMHPAGFKECTIKFEYYSLGFDKETKDSDSKMITQLEIFDSKSEKIHDSWFRNDDPKYAAQQHEVKLSEEGLYHFTFNNLDEVDFMTTMITGFFECDKHSEVMKNSDMVRLQQKAEANINQLFMNLGRLTTEENLVENRRNATKKTHSKLLYGCVGEIFAIVVVSWWQIYYMTSILDKKLII